MSSTASQGPPPREGWDFGHRLAGLEDRIKTSLTFTDVIFGLVIRQIFIEAVPYARLDPTVLLHLSLVLVVVVGSYIGYRRSLKRGELPLPFFSLPLIRFALDLFMIFLYYLMTVTPDTSASSPVVSPRFDAAVLAMVFFLYLLWDLVSARMVQKYRVSWRLDRTMLTFGGLAACLLVLFYSHHVTATQHQILGIEAALILVVLIYRFLKDAAPEKGRNLPPVVLPSPTEAAAGAAEAAKAAAASAREAADSAQAVATSVAANTAAVSALAAKYEAAVASATATAQVAPTLPSLPGSGSDVKPT